MDQAEKIQKNFETFRSLCEKLGDRSEAVLKMVDHFGERLALCPASSRIHYHLAVPGGLIQHSLNVLTNTAKLVKLYDLDIPKESLIISTLYHDIGKIGDRDNDRYLPQTNSWYKDRGENYEINKNCQYLPVSQMSVFLMQQFGIQLSYLEYCSILYNDGLFDEANKAALKSFQLPIFATVLHHADLMSSLFEKGKTEL